MIEIKVEASGYLQQLIHAIVPTYTCVNKTPTQIATDLLAFQTLEPKITLGTIQPTGNYSFTWSKTNSLGCFNSAQEAIGGYIEVNDDREFNWLTSIGEDNGQQIRYRKNILGVEEDDDWLGLATRLYPECSNAALSDIAVGLEVADKSSDATYGYLTITQGDYICYDIDTLEVLRKGAATNYTADIAGNYGGTNWSNPSNVLNIDWSTYASWNFGINSASNMLGIKWSSNKVISGCGIRLQLGGGTLNRLRIYYTLDNFTTNTLLSTEYSLYTSGDGAVEHIIDFGETIEVQGLAFDFAMGGGVANTAYVFSFWGLTEYYDESASWTDIDGHQLRIPIASYHADDTYYLSYNYADFIKDFEKIIAPYNYGDIGTQMTFNFANDAQTLLAYAQNQMPLISSVPKTYNSNIILLNEVNKNFTSEELDLGNTISLIHEILGIEDKITIAGITQNLDKPGEGSIEIERKTKTLADAFRFVLNKI